MTARLSLPDVSIVCIDNVAIDLAHMAIRDCTDKVDFGGSWFCTPNEGDNYGEILQCRVARDLRTSHALIVQYDSWILDAGRWDPEWLQYDYIGAPWPWYPDAMKVGNGGFSLRSRRLMEFLAKHCEEYPCLHPEDAYLCRQWRPRLEQEGFKWAPVDVAERFSFERDTPRPSFGFHGIFNWPHVLSPDGLIERVVRSTAYVRSKPEWGELAIIKALYP